MNITSKIYNRNRLRLIKALTLIFVVIAGINFYFVFEVTAIPNDECLWVPKFVNEDSTVYVFDQVKFEGAAWNAGIRDGDYLIKINGTRATNAFTANQAIINGPNRDVATFTVLRNGEYFDTEVRLKRFVNFSGLSANILALIWLLVGYVAVLAKPNGRPQSLFYKIGAAGVLYAMFNIQLLTSGVNPIYNYPFLALFIDLIQSIGFVFVPFLLVQFFWVFPRESEIINRRSTKRIFIILPALLYVGALVYKSFLVYGVSVYSASAAISRLYLIFLGIFFIAMVIAFISLIRGYLKITDPKERTAIFIIIISTVVAVASVIYTNMLAPALADNMFNSPEYFMPIYLTALIPISFGYGVFKYSLMDVTDVVKNTILYGVATLTVAAIYFLTIYVVGQSISQALSTEYQGIIAGIIFIGFAVIFQSTKDKFQEIVTRRFYPEQFAFQKVVVKFSRDISTIVGLENILDSAQNTFVDSLNLQQFAIALRQNGSEKYKFEKRSGIKGELSDFSVSTSLLESFVFRKEEAKLQPVVEQFEFDAVFAENSDMLNQAKIYTAIPLRIKNRFIGFIFFGLKQSGAQFAGTDLELLVAASNQLAASCENARLYLSEVEKLKLETDLENARKIQEKLLPEKVPEFKGFDIAGVMIPAMHIGGDYYDLIKISDTKLFVIVGDVSGKGLSASFYMSKIQTMMRLYCVDEKSPAEIMKEINNRLTDSIEKNWFITVALGLFDLEQETLTFCRAGHTPLSIFTEEGESIIKPSGIGLGLEKGEKFDSSLEEKTISIHPGQIFLFYSDGLNEAMNIEDELFGNHRVSELIMKTKDKSAIITRNELVNSVGVFRGTAEQNDDITLVVMKYTG